VSELVALIDHWPVVAAVVGLVLHRFLMFIIALWGVATKDEHRRKAAIDILRILKPGILPRKSDAGSSQG
jgi:hypothetical protein